MIEHTLVCDTCSRIILANGESPAQARRLAQQQCGAVRRGCRDLCVDCAKQEGKTDDR